MNTQLIGLLAETSIHPGAGQSAGVVDLPVAREATTGYPVVPGSSLKGALLAHARRSGLPDLKRIFGEADNAGALLVSDARLLLLPVRSLHTASKWVTCPHLLERFERDKHRAGNSTSMPTCSVAAGKYLGLESSALFLEERQFSHSGTIADELVKALATLILHASTRARLAAQLVVLHDDDFVWFARNGLAVQARNVLDEDKKTSKNLWYEETIPPDALFYTLLAERQSSALDAIHGLFKDHAYLQVGGNETVGMGWCALAFPPAKGGAS